MAVKRFRLLMIVWLILTAAGCTRQQARPAFALSKNIPVDEQEMVITRKPTGFQPINDSLLAAVINLREFALYNYNTGQLKARFDFNQVNTDSLLQALVSLHPEREYISASDIRESGHPAHELYAFFHDRERKAYWLYYLMLAPYLIDYEHEGEMTKARKITYQHYLLVIDNTLRLKKLLPVHQMLAGKAEQAEKYTLVSHHGFIVERDQIIANVLIHKGENMVLHKDPFLPICAAFDILNHDSLAFRKLLPVPHPEDGAGKEAALSYHAYFQEYGDSVYVSNGKKLYNAVTGKEKLKGLIHHEDDYLANFQWGKPYDHLFFYSTIEKDRVGGEINHFYLKVNDMDNNEVISSIRIGNVKQADYIAFHNDKAVSIVKEGERYYFRTYTLSDEDH